MALSKHNDKRELFLPDGKGSVVDSVLGSLCRADHEFGRTGRLFGRILKPVFLISSLMLLAFFLISLDALGINSQVPGKAWSDGFGNGLVLEAPTSEPHKPLEVLHRSGGRESDKDVISYSSSGTSSNNNNDNVSSTANVRFDGSGGGLVLKAPTSEPHKPHYPCKVGFLESVDYFVEPREVGNFTQFSLQYVDVEDNNSMPSSLKPRFGGHQTEEERKRSFFGEDHHKLHCGFVKGPPGSSSSGFDLVKKDQVYMNSCQIVVSSCIFGSFDFLRRPTTKISEFSKKNACFVMFVDKQTLHKLSSDGNIPDGRGYIDLWRIVVVRNLPYEDMRRTGKVPKFLSHRLFPSARYSIWIDSKLKLAVDPMLIIEYFLWRKRSEYAISNHYDRHCVWDEVLQNKILNKYHHDAIDEQFNFYKSDGLSKFNPSNPHNLLPSYVPEASVIVRAHTPMSNLFSCLWFNEVDRFTSRDQLSFGYTYLKLRRSNPDRPFYLNMFKDCQRRALARIFQHRIVSLPPPSPS